MTHLLKIALQLFLINLAVNSASAQALNGTSLTISGNGSLTGNLNLAGSFGLGQPTAGIPAVTFDTFAEPYLVTLEYRGHPSPQAGAVTSWVWSADGYPDPTPMYFYLDNSTEEAGLAVNGRISASSMWVNSQPVATVTQTQTLIQTTLNSISQNVTFNGSANRSISVNPPPTGAGKSLTIQAGNPGIGSNLAGGNLLLSSGSSRGNQGSTMEFKTASTGAAGSAFNTPQTRLKIGADGGIAAGDGLTTFGTPQFVIGSFNPTSTNNNGTNHTNGPLIIGIGTPTEAKNALRVRSDGVILINPAPGINPGIFTAGEKP